MYKLVGVNNSADYGMLYAIVDTEDGKLDVVTEEQIKEFLEIGFDIGGVVPSASGFTTTDEYYPKSKPQIMGIDLGQSSDSDEEYDDADEYEDEPVENDDAFDDYDDDEFEVETNESPQTGNTDRFTASEVREFIESVADLDMIISYFNKEMCETPNISGNYSFGVYYRTDANKNAGKPFYEFSVSNGNQRNIASSFGTDEDNLPDSVINELTAILNAFADEGEYEDYSDDEEADCYDDYNDNEYDDWENEDFGYPEESTSSKLYALLTEEQKKCLQLYYLWVSQQIIQNGNAVNLSVTPKKAQQLQDLRKTGTNWMYAGFVDMGYFGAAHCTLGHKLRYLHLAWDVDKSDLNETFWGTDFNYDSVFKAIWSDSAVLFGIKCVSDFFEISEEDRGKLMKVQRDSMKDMIELYGIYSKGNVDAYKDSLSQMSEAVERMVPTSAMYLLAGKTPLVRPELLTFYKNFEACGMLPPRTLVKYIRDDLVGWETHKATGSLIGIPFDRMYEAYNFIQGGKCKGVVVDRVFKCGLSSLTYPYFYSYICGLYGYTGTAPNHEEGGRSKKVLADFKALKRNGDNCYNPLHNLTGKGNELKAVDVAKNIQLAYLNAEKAIMSVEKVFDFDSRNWLTISTDGSESGIETNKRIFSAINARLLYGFAYKNTDEYNALAKTNEVYFNSISESDYSIVGAMLITLTKKKSDKGWNKTDDSTKLSMTDFDSIARLLSCDVKGMAIGVNKYYDAYSSSQVKKLDIAMYEVLLKYFIPEVRGQEVQGTKLVTSIVQFMSEYHEAQAKEEDRKAEEENKAKATQQLSEQDLNNMVDKLKNDYDTHREEVDNQLRADADEEDRKREIRKEVIDACTCALSNQAELDKIKAVDPFAIRVMQSVARIGVASNRQMYYLSKAYKVLTGKDVYYFGEGKMIIAEHEEIAVDIEIVKSRKNELVDKLSPSTFRKTFAIFDTILERGEASSKQLSYLNEAKKLLGLS